MGLYTMELAELDAKTVAELQELASNVGLENYTKYRKRELIVELLKVLTKQEAYLLSRDLGDFNEGYGFLRVENYSRDRRIFMFPPRNPPV